ncbi:MAG: Gfo/Idh/MocA family oxidoreductase [Armatimonadia bacterium]
MGIRVGFCGVGAFANCFIPLFKAHPLVDEVMLCDLDAAKLKEKSEKFELPRTCNSLDELCETDMDAIAVFSQNWMHGPQAAQALRAGKDVYSAVPAGISFEDIENLVRAVEETGNIYMIGETSYYYPGAIYCRQRLANGDFGRVVYSEGEYYHDFDHGLYDVMKWRGGEKWREIAGGPPMHYPTHSTGQVVSVIDAHATHVSCFGFVDNHPDGLFRAEVNMWKNSFSNETGLFKMSDGSMMRINEFRRVGHPGTEAISIYGTEGCFEQQVDGQMWSTKERGTQVDLRDLLAPVGVPVKLEGEMSKVTDALTHTGMAKIHDVERLPKEFIGLPNGHLGAHQFLVDDFVKSCVEHVQPPNNVWQAARYVLPGLTAHESAVRGGELLEIRDYGDCPHEVVYF